MHKRVLDEHRRLLAKGTEPRGSLRVIATTLAAVVHLFTLALVAAAVAVWWTPLPIFLKLVVSTILLLSVWVTTPRVGRLTKRPVLRRSDAPHTFALLDRVCAATGARQIDVVVPTSEFNAGTGFVGIRRRECVLSVGLPMWNALEDQEKVTLLAHEAGHLVNGDLRQTFLVGTALTTLTKWQWLLTPERFFAYVGRRPQMALLDRLAMLALLPLSAVMALFANTLFRVASFAGQRAEYRADALAATIGGRDAAIALSDRAYFGDATLFAMKVALRNDPRSDIWAVGRAHTRDLPDSERERVRRNGVRALHRTDSSHPPTVLRLELLSSAPSAEPALRLHSDEARLVDAELMSVEPFVRERLVERMAL